MVQLHEKYAPILHFTKQERFFPMRVDDMLAYSSLFVKGKSTPVVPRGDVTPQQLAKQGDFLRTVDRGPLLGADVVKEWSEDAVELLLRWVQDSADDAPKASRGGWNSDLARKTYGWLTPQNRDAAQHFWWNSLIAPAVAGTLKSGSDNQLPRLILPREAHTDAVSRYRDTFKQKPAYTYYYRYLKDSQYLYLQYWFFYSYNDWGQSFSGLNDHEGDWECMMLFFKQDSNGRPIEPPAHVVYATHESRIPKSWDHEDVKRSGTHVEAFIGGGSHATYPQPKAYEIAKQYNLVDQAAGDGVTIDHDDWVHRINLADVPWLGQYQGSWGTRYWLETGQAKSIARIVLAATPLGALSGLLNSAPAEFELPGVSAPHGPLNAGRKQNNNPRGWANVT
jgi:hypothetical protein